ncbi:TIGR03826 family flagellar region protein [Paenibacillus sp. GP183]|uniref:TIGR03826 family flagellar region protein n=1 Tax=Paenibacillus sp. GP183 TaxID=1882751 RepID=UPI00089D3DD8|nr:TIGR03826 family flagellar region protein [Paenibacillus sp. GP183]SEC34082.1 flagellar operon protein TIGR03826 [Paenibacillus sp. GP183]
MSLNVANCPRCGRVFVKGIQEVCPNCLKEIELQFDICSKYLRENIGTGLRDLSEATEVPVRQITKFIREGRISIKNHPNMGYPCESCGNDIREGQICDSCRSKLVKGMSNSLEDEARRQERLREDSKSSFYIKDRLKNRY